MKSTIFQTYILPVCNISTDLLGSLMEVNIRIAFLDSLVFFQKQSPDAYRRVSSRAYAQ